MRYRKLRILFGLLSLLFLIAGLAVSLYEYNKRIIKTTKDDPGFKVQKISVIRLTDPASDERPPPVRFYDTDESYSITLPKGGWYDTGIWVQFEERIRAVPHRVFDGQPFWMEIAKQEVKSAIDFNHFQATACLVPNISRYTGEVLILITKPEKIYLKLDDEAVGDSLVINLHVEAWRVSKGGTIVY